MTNSKEKFSVYKVITEREYYEEGELAEDEIELVGTSETFDDAINILEEIEEEGYEGVIKDNETDEFITGQEISGWYMAQEFMD